MFDIDNFKQMQDSDPFKHLSGDAVLRVVAGRVSDLVRDIDLVARYGGEEFAVLLPQTGMEGAVRLAERLREAVAGQPVDFGEHRIWGVTASFGVAAGPTHRRVAARPRRGRRPGPVRRQARRQEPGHGVGR